LSFQALDSPATTTNITTFLVLPLDKVLIVSSLKRVGIMSQGSNSRCEEPPVYTEFAPLLWVDLSIWGRHLKDIPWTIAHEAVPISTSFYVALYKVSCLAGSRLAKPDDELFRSEEKQKEVSGLLEYVLTFIHHINEGMPF
jgi:hypothetical protein